MVNDRVIDILVVEDEMNAELLIRRIREEFKDNVRIHKNGHGLLSDLNQYKDLDLVIVDHQYAKEDMSNAVKTIRHRNPETEIVVLSSDRDPEMINKIKSAGAYDFIYKDVSAVSKVIYVIKNFWNRKELVKENINLKKKSEKSGNIVVIMILFILAVVALVVYFLAN